MSIDAIKNFAESNLVYPITSTETEITLPNGHTERFPNPNTDGEFNIIIYNSTDYDKSSEAIRSGEGEIVRVKLLSGSTFTIERAQENTAAVDLNKPAVIYSVVQALTAKTINDLKLQPPGYTGEIKMFAGNTPPENWVLCEGQSLQIADYPQLYNVIGTLYGGDGITTFALPDLRGRFPLGSGTGTGLTERITADYGGNENIVLSENQLPAHNHTVNCDMLTDSRSESAHPVDNILARTTHGMNFGSNFSGNDLMHQNMLNQTGNDDPINIIPPYLCINFIICLSGVSPLNS